MLLLQFLLAAGATASSCGAPTLKHVSNLISFGDSYTDEGRLSAYFANHGSAPPPGTSTAGSNLTSTGGYAWGTYASQQLGAKYYDYAGKIPMSKNATITPRLLMDFLYTNVWGSKMARD
jgi:phospholipase/lecithinase/hemolysin